MTDHSYEMASAYCDDELDLAQRAVVEGDPEMLALVSEIRSTQAITAALGSEPLPDSHLPSEATRKGHLAAASAAFDDLFASTPVTAASASAPVIDLRSRRQRHTKILTLAAGLIVVAGIGMLALTNISRSDGDTDTAAADFGTDEADGTAATMQSFDATEEALPEAMANEEVRAGGAAPATDETSTAMSDDAAESAAFDDDAADSAAFDEEEGADGAGESQIAVLTKEFTPPLFVFDEGTDLATIAETIGQPTELEPLSLCTPWGYTPGSVEVDVPIQVGESLLGYAVIDDAGTPTAVLYSPECYLNEIMALAD